MDACLASSLPLLAPPPCFPSPIRRPLHPHAAPASPNLSWVPALSCNAAKERAFSQRFRLLPRSSSLGNEGDSGEDDLGAKLESSDWRAFRARLLRTSSDAATSSPPQHQWAHALVEPEPGCLLLAHPQAFAVSQHYFNQAVVFLFSYGKEGSAGLMLNRPTEYTLGQVSGFPDFLPEFQNSPLYMGGDVGANALHVIHGVPDLDGSHEIVSGVYMGGLESMQKSMQTGESSMMDYRWFVRYAGWGPGQLEREVASGVWYLACSSKNFILKHTTEFPKPLWREILELMGDPYYGISSLTWEFTFLLLNVLPKVNRVR